MAHLWGHILGFIQLIDFVYYLSYSSKKLCILHGTYCFAFEIILCFISFFYFGDWLNEKNMFYTLVTLIPLFTLISSII